MIQQQNLFVKGFFNLHCEFKAGEESFNTRKIKIVTNYLLLSAVWHTVRKKKPEFQITFI